MSGASSTSRTTLYDVLGVPKAATETEVARAYRRRALQCHPDRNPDGAEDFKALSNAYAVLSDPEKRALYDLTGVVPGSAQDAADGEGGASMQERSQDIQEQLRVFFATYRGSAEERADFVASYTKAQGDFRKMVREYLLFDNGDEGEVQRLASLGAALIASGKLADTEAWQRSTSAQGIRKAERDMRRERAEAEEALRDMGLDEESQRRAQQASTDGDLGALQLLMRQRQQNSWQSMMANLEAKYGAAEREEGRPRSARKKEKLSGPGSRKRDVLGGDDRLEEREAGQARQKPRRR